jgi:hypothetical protein
MKRVVLGALFLVLACGIIIAHPHFAKTIMAKLQNGPEFKLEHITLPYNESHLKEVKDGFLFHCGRAKLNINKEVQSGKTKIPAGNYALRAKAKTADDWTLVLIPESAMPATGQQPDMAKMMASALPLESKTITGHSNMDHLELNIMPGHGATDGKIVLSVGFGTRVVEGVLSVAPTQSAHNQ